MARKTFEDLPVGTVLTFGAYKVTREEIIAYASEFDPQGFHLNDEVANASLLGGLAASGYHTCAMTMRMVADDFLNDADALGAPGIEEIRWLRPVRPGMVLSIRMKVIATRVSRSRPEMGLVRYEMDTLDETGDVMMTQRYTGIFGRRSTDMPADEGEQPPVRTRVPDPPPVGEAGNATRFASYYDDVVIGARLDLGAYTFERQRVIDFARAYDPQPFHLDDEAASKTYFGRLAASGWHTAAAYMRCYVMTRNRIRDEALARGETIIPNGPSPGIRDIRWIKPVYPDDTVRYTSTVISKRQHIRPGWGLIMSRAIGTNQHGEQVYEASGAVLLPMRDAGSVPAE